MKRKTPEKTAPQTDRLQKILARGGMGSRRALEKRIADGQVQVNDRTARLGDQVGDGDLITIDGTRYRVEQGPGETGRVIIYNKPEGLVCTRSDPEGRPTVFDKVKPVRAREWIAIGRLDLNTTGLLLFTTDGELANAMMHPSHGVDREYACRVHGQVSEEMIEQLKSGVELEDGPAQFSDIQAAGGRGENRWFHVALLEGRNREVRRLWAAVGLEVSRLKRVRYGAVFMPSRLKLGRWEELTAGDVRTIRTDVGLKARPATQLTLKRLSGGRRPRR